MSQVYVLKRCDKHGTALSTHGVLREAIIKAAHLHYTGGGHHRVHANDGELIYSTDDGERTRFSGKVVDAATGEVSDRVDPRWQPCDAKDRIP